MRQPQCQYTFILSTLPFQILSISSLTGCFSRIGLLAYRDYSDPDLIEWSGWLYQDRPSEELPDPQPDLIQMAKGLKAAGGGDYPEAVKTALAKAYEVMRPEAETLILLYTDAPPHANSMVKTRSSNSEKEKINLERYFPKSYGGYGPLFVDWVSAANTFASGEKHAQVFAVLSSRMDLESGAYYEYLAAITGGACLYLDRAVPKAISTVTIQLLLTWMRIEKARAPNHDADEELPATLSRYTSLNGIDKLKNESSSWVEHFFPSADPGPGFKKANITTRTLTTSVMKEYLPKKPYPLQDFSKRWYTDGAYKEMAFRLLLDIIKIDVCAMALNPVFGSLWRTVCSDRTYVGRDALVHAFNQSLEKIHDEDQKAKMRKWLDESYDYTADIIAAIENVPADEQYPCVFLDPTLNFTRSATDVDMEADDTDLHTSLSYLTRSDILEIGRSCNAKILRRLNRILTRLTFVNSASEMPEHIANTSLEQVPRIPMALTQKKYERQFWRILFHLIIPGTQLSSRPGALVAALSLRVGLSPLMEAAVEEMMCFRDKWNDPSTPENWTFGCLTLLMDANDNYRIHQQKSPGPDGNGQIRNLLHPHDRELFTRLVAFKILEYNLDTPLTVCVSWKPNKSVASIGPIVMCSGCQYPRSVTIMGEGGKCGLCLVSEWASPEEKEKSMHARVSSDITASSDATWVECCVTTCRVQYVVYNVDDMKVRAKCHYCRNNSTAPLVECNKCQNRMIWPEAYREGLMESEFICPPCNSGHRPDTEVDVTAKQLAAENAFNTWLVHDSQGENDTNFWQKSIFNIISAIEPQEFVSRIKLFPDREDPLVYKGKPILNTKQLIETLREKVNSRKTAQTECSLCFSTFRPSALNPACGRRGCLQKICPDCLAGWYGLNTPGSVINTAALGCPFCRRFPASRTLAKHGMGIHAVQNLANAVRDKGFMIYAWCRDCHTAKELMERTCAGETTPELRRWSCEECITQHYAPRGDTDQSTVTSIKPCPGCGTMSEKISGCGHIYCPVPDCGAHWCYFCGKELGAGEIYKHMSWAHDGFFGDEVQTAFEDDDDYDDEMIY